MEKLLQEISDWLILVSAILYAIIGLISFFKGED